MSADGLVPPGAKTSNLGPMYAWDRQLTYEGDWYDIFPCAFCLMLPDQMSPFMNKLKIK